MKIGFGKINKHAILPEQQGRIFPLVTPITVELQAGERINLKTGLVVRVPEGYILSIQSSPTLLILKDLEILGPPFVVPGEEEELKIPLYNAGKKQLNLQPGMQICEAMLISVAPVEIEEFEVGESKKKIIPPEQSRRNPFKFEVN